MERINIGVVGDFPSGIVISIIQAYNLGDIKAAQQSVQADGTCACDYRIGNWSPLPSGEICPACKLPRH